MGRAVAQSVRFRLQSHLANRMQEEAPNQLNLRALPHRDRPPDRPVRRAPTDYSERPAHYADCRATHSPLGRTQADRPSPPPTGRLPNAVRRRTLAEAARPQSTLLRIRCDSPWSVRALRCAVADCEGGFGEGCRKLMPRVGNHGDVDTTASLAALS